MQPLVEISNLNVLFTLRKWFGRPRIIRAVRDLSLNIYKGETLSLVGESGSGKTTLGRALLRLLPSTGGKIIFEGRDITDLNESELRWFRAEAQAIFQDPYSSLNPFMILEQILEEPLAIHRISNRNMKIKNALTEVRLTPPEQFMKRYPHMLSGGQRQRVGIARSLIMRPKFIVADEPVSMIDASSRSEILQLLDALKEEFEFTILYITHDIATARHYSQRIAVIYSGELVEIGEPSQVIDTPFHPYTKALITSIPELDPSNRLSKREVLFGEIPDPENRPEGCTFHPRCPHMIPGLCDIRSPILHSQESNHWVACHLYSKEP